MFNLSATEQIITDDILEEIKVIVGLEPIISTEDDKIYRFIRRATNTILRHLNDSSETSETVKNKYFDVVVDFSIYLYKKKDKTGIKQYSEGGQSVTYSDESDSMPDTIKAMLPPPCIRIGGY